MRWLHDPSPPAPAATITAGVCEKTSRTRAVFRHWHWIAPVVLALGIAAGQAFFLAAFWAPAPGRPGIDENAYLVAGKNIALTGSPALHVTDDFQFVDAMWISARSGAFYPKYPIGLSLLDALAIRCTGDPAHLAARKAAFVVSPLCMILASLGMAVLAFMLTGSPFYALLAMIVLITAPAVLQLSELPNSHAPSLCLVTWGMVLLLRFYRTDSALAGAGAGLLLGYAVTCRYSEALLLFPLFPLKQVLSDTRLEAAHPILWCLMMVCRLLPIGPLGIAAMLTIRWRDRRTYFRAAIPVAAWALPVSTLLAFNWFAMGHFTGYDATRESSGFTTAEFLRKWDFAVQHLYVYGLFLIAPLGVAGLGLMFRRQWRDALLLTMWFVPGALLYTAYYWGMQSPGVGFLRFLVTVFPPLIVGAMWLLQSAASASGGIAESLTAGLLVGSAACIGLIGSLHVMNIQHLGNLNLAVSAENAIHAIDRVDGNSKGRVIFADEGIFPQFLQYAQFMIDARWYASDAFAPQIYGGFGFLGMLQNDGAASAPVLVQPDRIKHMMEVRRSLAPAMLAARELKVVVDAMAAGQQVFAILTEAQRSRMTAVLAGGHIELSKLSGWTEPCRVPLDVPDEPTPANPGDGTPGDNALSPPFDAGKGLFAWAPQSLAVYQARPAGLKTVGVARP